MTVENITQLINTVGFPVACCCVLFWQNSKLSETLSELSTTLKGIEDRLACIERNQED